MNVKNMQRTTLLCLVFAAFGCGKNSITDLYDFAATKDVKVKVDINFKIESAEGPAVDFSEASYLLNAYALDAGDAQVQVGYENDQPVTDLPVSLTAPTMTFNAILRIPAETQPRESGYAIRFVLKDKNAALRLDGADPTLLSALRGDIQSGTTPDENQVELSVATTIAAELIKSSVTDAGSKVSLDAYAKLIEILKERVKQVESNADTAQRPKGADYARAIRAGLMYQVVTETALQEKLAGEITQSTASVTDESTIAAARKQLAEGFNKALKTFVTQVSDYLGDATTATAKVFPSTYIKPESIPNPSDYNSSVYAPTALTFTDGDNTDKVGGTISITAPKIVTGITAYNIYFGKNAKSDTKTLITKLTIAASGSITTYDLPNGTSVPADSTKLWVYPVANDTEIDMPISIALVNNVSTSSGGTTQSAGEAAAATFGSPFGSYIEDGWNASCILLSKTKIVCKGSYYDGVNDVTQTTGWTSGATIRGYYNLEASTYIEDSEGEVWSIGQTGGTIPVGRSGSNTTLAKMTFTGRASGTKLVGISGDHQRATALFDNGQVFSWNAANAPGERLTSGSHTGPIKYLYDALLYECFIDSLDKMYCKDPSSSSTPAFSWTPSSSEEVFSNAKAMQMAYNIGGSAPWNAIVKHTNGHIYTSSTTSPTPSTTFTDTGLVALSSAGNFAYTPAHGVSGNKQEFLIIASNGKAYNSSGELASFGSSNKSVGAAATGVGGKRHFILSGDGKVYGAVNADMASAEVFGGYDDVVMMRVLYRDVCVIRSNNEVRCAGTNTGGTYTAPTLLGTRED